MKTLLLFTLMGIFGAAPAWELDLKKAQEEATESKKMILLNFSHLFSCIFDDFENKLNLN